MCEQARFDVFFHENLLQKETKLRWKWSLLETWGSLEMSCWSGKYHKNKQIFYLNIQYCFLASGYKKKLVYSPNIFTKNWIKSYDNQSLDRFSSECLLSDICVRCKGKFLYPLMLTCIYHILFILAVKNIRRYMYCERNWALSFAYR